MSSRAPIAVLGGGSFGTVVANMVAEKGIEARLWVRNSEAADAINQTRENARYVPGYRLLRGVKATSDLETALSGAAMIFVAIPSSAFRSVIHQAKPFIQADQPLISTTKGIEASTFSLMSQILEEELPGHAIGVLSGPNLAKEIAKRELTATVVASRDAALRRAVQALLQAPYFRVYAAEDTYGVELAGTLKNIYAIAAGMAASMGVGENTRAFLITRSLAEMSRLADSMGANPMTFLGLAGVGDLIVTCTSALSRNYRVGYALGEGKSLDQVVAQLGEVAEGVNTLKLVQEHSQQSEVYMPIVRGLYSVVFEGAPVVEVVSEFMASVQSSDVEFTLPHETAGC